MKRLLVTGSSGLIGSEVCTYFAREFGYAVHGVDNNQRSVFFGPEADTRWNQRRLARDVQASGGAHVIERRFRLGALHIMPLVAN